VPPRRRGLILALAALGIGASFPMVLLNHVSELYAYNSMPFVSMIADISLGSLCPFANTWRPKQVMGVMLVLLFASHIIAVKQKTSLMEENGTRATMLLDRIQPYAQKASQGSELLLVNPDAMSPEYSIFLMSGFNVLKEGESRINKVSNRNDIRVKIITERDFKGLQEDGQKALVLYLDGDSITVWNKSRAW
jgi:hypothetical protein